MCEVLVPQVTRTKVGTCRIHVVEPVTGDLELIIHDQHLSEPTCILDP